MFSKTRKVREERVVLEDRVRRALEGRKVGDILVTEEDGAGRDFLEAADHPQRRRLAAARWAEKGEKLALGDLEREVLHGGEVTEPLGHPLDPDVSFGHARPLANLVALQ